ncbi:T9SS type A sorting domain-containing protein [Chryseobacterium gallinarum]|uniref:Secretion protein n=1 Tax=Chryseobacterium gallinarum TaxID=1324352 RepID=A0A0G3M6F2_CHRGL|nr:T9SS type A sorting domain-containing protein [Chryseobacterium gallinarum]AKK72627.1 secretion protein [Chryseobacterium gallinarum]MCL8536240.1 T9SS type A sorting domain-containing protein [Chryseobacterium gallinarum]QIY91634.1 T9SS type A sorting domain-containing protein [Chryseobacterium gallinarum]
MKTNLIFFAVVLFGILNIKAQCNPTVTSPRLGLVYQDKILFCNTENEVLSTQTYSNYQWYKQQWTWQTPNTNPWVAIPGATSQQLTINGYDDQLYYFKVAVTEGDCTAESPAIMADGYVYGLPSMISTFTPGTYEEIGPGEFNICTGASVKFDNTFPAVYGIHTWFKCFPGNIPPSANDPCIISGVTGDSYTATESGEYGFYACTEYCPDQCEFLGTNSFVKLNFGEWDFCKSLGTGEIKTKGNNLKVYPNPTVQFLYIGKESDKIYKEVSIIDMTGRLILKKNDHKYNEPIDVSSLAPGNYMIISKSSDGKNEFKNKFIKK